MTDSGLLKRVYYDSPERGWKTKKDYVASIIFEFNLPIVLPEYDVEREEYTDETIVSKEWVMLVETSILDQVQIASIEKGGPTGWTLGDMVYDSEPAHDKKAIQWMAENYELID